MDTIDIAVNIFLYGFVPLVLISLFAIVLNLLLKITAGIHLVLATLLQLVGIDIHTKKSQESTHCKFL